MDSALAKLCALVETKVRQYGVAGLDAEGGLLFEPRVLWDVGRMDIATPQPSPTRLAPGELNLNREKFRNGARWPIVITRLSLAAINYLLAANDNGDAVNAGSFRNASSVLGSAKFILGVPNRQFYSQRSVIVTAASMRPTGDPDMANTGSPLASSLFGLSRLEFDKKLHLPRNGAIELHLGAYTMPADGIASALATVTVEEIGGINPGAVRTHSFAVGKLRGSAVPVFPPDAFGSAGVQGADIPFFATQAFRADAFIKQKPSRGTASASFGAINVLLNQIDYDLGVINAGSTSPISPLSLRIPTKAKTVGGGTGTDWWEPGCPLALAFTEITPALVYDLPMPIVLNPGDTLDVQLVLPLQTGTAEPIVTPIYQIGVAAGGFAVIEG